MTKKQKKVFWRILAAVVLLVLLYFVPVEGMPRLLLYLIPYLVIGYDILRKAALGIFHREIFDENFLMAVATVGAVLLGEYQEGVAVMLFYQIGELFQSVAVGKSRRNISALMDIRPDFANIENGSGGLEQVDPDEVEIGTVIVVCPGEKVPIDGRVEEGHSTLNTSALTGESMPREVAVGDEVVSGCVNTSGLLKIRTTKAFGESTVSKILDLVENSSMKKSRSENFITKFAKYYTPAVCCGALALAILPPLFLLFTGKPALWSDWIIRALTFLVISCPCALVISIPLSFFGGIGGASARGILVKGSNYLEALAKTGCVVFDKTGTLTKGVFEVAEIVPAEGWQPVPEQSGTAVQDSASAGSEHYPEDLSGSLLYYAVHAESYSNHPISKSLREAFGRPLDSEAVADVEEIGGHGVTAGVNGHRVAAGNDKLMRREKISCAEPSGIGTVIHVAVDGAYAGYILIADTVKENAKASIAALKAAGVKKTVMLTGDSRIVADSVAADLGVDEVCGELLPGDKVERVEALLAAKSRKENLAFVGDGINDAPVLSRADIGIAMGAMGSDAAIEAADIVLMDDDPMKIALAMKISRKCLRIVYENIVFALGVKAVCLILGALGIAGMWMAIFADVGVMVLAVLNAIRCLKVKGLRAA
ncbi:MAG: heavy metal translocating P-type ATPase [Muribaculum sp.]|nr:heavy metal translocating P-type ATPase [Muribaculum sp.]